MSEKESISYVSVRRRSYKLSQCHGTQYYQEKRLFASEEIPLVKTGNLIPRGQSDRSVETGILCVWERTERILCGSVKQELILLVEGRKEGIL